MQRKLRGGQKKALECGMDGFLSKPIVIEELIGILQHNLV